jgi:outer membrane receptor protein involved in Fe transport
MKFNQLLAVFAAVLLVGGSIAFGQTTAILTGTVMMDNGALPGVSVTITSPQLQGSRTTTTDVNGNYNFGAIPPGAYKVSFEMQGLQPVAKNAQVGLSQTARVDATMKVTAVAEAITVTASAPTVNESSEVQSNYSQKLVNDLPMGRTLAATTNLAPGVTSNGPAGATMISGGQSFDNTYYVDGAVVNEVLRGQPQNLFIEDAIQETTVQTAGISAEFGRFSGGVVTAISKSGGNEFSGSFRDSLYTPTWTAQGKLKEPRPARDMQSTYEATLGGPILRDRIWFFAAGRKFDASGTRNFGTLTKGETPVAYPYTDNERRLEGKVTAQLTQKHALSGSYFKIDRAQTNNAQGTPLDVSALDANRTLPNTFYTANYNGVITNSFLIEALYAKQTFQFVGSGADAPATPERGSTLNVVGFGNAGYPFFCSACSGFPESRNNQNAKLKGSYFLSSKSAGTHNLTAGYEDYKDMLKSDNHQSASDFAVYTYDAPRRDANGTPLLTLNTAEGGIAWWPILNSSKGNVFKTQSLFANDRWTISSNLEANIGVRYDANKATDQAGQKVANDSKASPRLGLVYDVWSNGRLRLNASYSEYVSKIANGNVGDATSNAGSPSLLYWYYYGPNIVDQPRDKFLDQVFAWLRSQGFTNLKPDFARTTGFTTKLAGGLISPSVNEFTVGAGTQVGNAVLRADYQHRTWKNFYGSYANTSTSTVNDPLSGAVQDLTLVANSNNFTRKYDAVLMQGAYRLLNRVDIGANYTWSKLKGNIVGETSGSGPILSGDPVLNYPEFYHFANNNPVGYLGSDQRHKLRAWAATDIPVRIGTINLSLLQRYDSGTPYSVAGSVYVAQSTSCPTCPKNTFGYRAIGGTTSATYYFGQRGALRTDNISATDLAATFSVPVSRARFYAKGQVTNLFNSQAVLNPNTTVYTATTSACKQTTGANVGKRCTAFNPFTETPVEGINYVKGPNFGLPLNATTGTTGGDFQTPLTMRLSFGVQF